MFAEFRRQFGGQDKTHGVQIADACKAESTIACSLLTEKKV